MQVMLPPGQPQGQSVGHGGVTAAGVALDLALKAVLPRRAMANRIFVPALTVSFPEIAPLAPVVLCRQRGRRNEGSPSQSNPLRDEPQESPPGHGSTERFGQFVESSVVHGSATFPMTPRGEAMMSVITLLVEKCAPTTAPTARRDAKRKRGTPSVEETRP